MAVWPGACGWSMRLLHPITFMSCIVLLAIFVYAAQVHVMQRRGGSTIDRWREHALLHSGGFSSQRRENSSDLGTLHAIPSLQQAPDAPPQGGTTAPAHQVAGLGLHGGGTYVSAHAENETAAAPDATDFSQLPECSFGAPMGEGVCAFNGTVWACAHVDGKLNYAKNDPVPSIHCLGGWQSFGTCAGGQFLCEATRNVGWTERALDLVIGVVSIPRPGSLLNVTLSSLLELLPAAPPHGGQGMRATAAGHSALRVINLRPADHDFKALRAWWRDRASPSVLGFEELAVPSVHHLNSSFHVRELSAAVKAQLGPSPLDAKDSREHLGESSARSWPVTTAVGQAKALLPRASVIQQTVDFAVAIRHLLRLRSRFILLLEDDFVACQDLKPVLTEAMLVLHQSSTTTGVWLSVGGNGFLLRTSDWDRLASFLLDNVGGVSGIVDGVCKGGSIAGAGGDCLQQLPVDWLIQDFLLGNSRCQCCCGEPYQDPRRTSHGLGAPSAAAPRPTLLRSRPPVFVHQGHFSTLGHTNPDLPHRPNAMAAADSFHHRVRTDVEMECQRRIRQDGKSVLTPLAR